MIDLKNILLVLVGSAAGGSLRYITSLMIHSKNSTQFPMGTFLINLIGCFVIGMVYAMAARNATTGSDIKLLLATGFCGGFTTFSAFAFENLELFKSGMHMTALMYVILSVTLGILAVVLGASLIK
ncbi:MAG: fluoride efflux transporter CrcB [Chitinophagaceae bacterium]|jgi:CrcB protein|nr:fluoride efflux transporter CrcB [Chitinophagaceae bacterium]